MNFKRVSYYSVMAVLACAIFATAFGMIFALNNSKIASVDAATTATGTVKYVGFPKSITPYCIITVYTGLESKSTVLTGSSTSLPTNYSGKIEVTIPMYSSAVFNSGVESTKNGSTYYINSGTLNSITITFNDNDYFGNNSLQTPPKK